MTALFCDLVGSTRLGEQPRPGTAPPDPGALLRRDALGRRAPRRPRGEIHRRRGRGHVRRAARPRGRWTASGAGGDRDARAAGDAERERADPSRWPGSGSRPARWSVRRGRAGGRRRHEHRLAAAVGCRARWRADRGADLATGAQTRWWPRRSGRWTPRARPSLASLARDCDRSGGTAECDAVRRARAPHAAMLEEALEDAIDAGASVLVTILAPPGVGKSRLAEAFAAEVAERATVLVGQTPSYGEGVTFAPLVELLAQAAGTPSGDAAAVASALRERMVAQPDGASVGDRLAQFLGVGEAVGADTSWAVRRLLEVLASERPLVVMLEDLHSAEPPMLDLADAVIERVHGRRPLPVPGAARARGAAPDLGLRQAARDHDDPPAARTGGRPHGRRAAAGRERPRVRRRPDLRDGRRESALPGAADGDARGSRTARRRPLAGIGRCPRGDPRVIAGAPRRPARPPRTRTAPDPRASIHRRPPVPDRGAARRSPPSSRPTRSKPRSRHSIARA